LKDGLDRKLKEKFGPAALIFKLAGSGYYYPGGMTFNCVGVRSTVCSQTSRGVIMRVTNG
jgi:hypothetical protein